MTKLPSSNFKSLLHVLVDKNPPNRDKYVSCLAYLPTIREDIPFLFQYLSTEKDIDKLQMYIMVIFEIFSKRKPTDYNFQIEEIDSMFQSLIMMSHRLSLFKMCRDYSRILTLLLSFFQQNNEEQLLKIRRLMQQSVNIEIVYSAIAMHFPSVREDAFRFVVKDNNSHLINPTSLFSFSNILFAYKSYDNIPSELKFYVDLKNITEGLKSHGQNNDNISIFDWSAKKDNSKHDEYLNCIEDPSKHDFILYFLYCVQEFYQTDTIMYLMQMYFNDIIFPSIDKNPQSRNLVAELISVMPASNSNPNFNIESQISAILVQISKYITDYNSDFSQKIFEFAKKRENDQSFVNTMVIMPSNPNRYTAAIYIGLGTNMFGNSCFVEGCFPAKVTDKELFKPILNAIPFLLQKKFIQETNINTILTSIFSILSYPSAKTDDVLDLALNALRGMINSHFTTFVFFGIIDSIDHILTDYLIPIIDLLIENKNEIQNVGQQQFLSEHKIKKYFKSVATVARSIESSLRTNQEKLSLLNFLNILSGNKIYEKPKDDDDKKAINEFWGNMQSKFTIIYVVCNYAFSLINSDHNIPNLLYTFYSTIIDLNESFSIVVSIIPYDESNFQTKQAIEKANLLIDNQFNYLENKKLTQNDKDKYENYFCDCFVSFYRTRLFVDQAKTIKHLSDLFKKEKFKLIKPYLQLIIVLSHQLSYQEYIVNSSINLEFKDKDDKLKRGGYDEICKAIGKILEYTEVSKFSNHLKVFEQVQKEARSAVFEAARNPDIFLSDSCIKGLINYPFFYNSYSFLLRKLKNKEKSDATVVADAWVNHLKIKDHDYNLNEEIAKEIISTITSNKEAATTTIVSTLITEITINDNEDEDEEIYNINDQKALPIINFLEKLAFYGCSKEYAFSEQDSKIILFFSRFCYSKIDEVRISAFSFIMNYFAVKFPYIDQGTSPKNVDPLYYYKNKHTGADRILVFLSLFSKVFDKRRTLASKVFKEISNLSIINIYHVLLCKSIVETNFVMSPNYLNFNIGYDKDYYGFYNVYNNQQMYPMYNQMNPMNNQQINPMYNQQINPMYNQQINPMYNQQINPMYDQQMYPMYDQQMYPMYNQQINPMYDQQMSPMYNQQVPQMTTADLMQNDRNVVSSYLLNDKISPNDELIPNNVLYSFSKRTFATSRASFEAQEVMKLIAIKDIDKFIHFLMSIKLTDFMRCVIKRIMYSTVLRNRFIDSFICYILRGGVKIGSDQKLDEDSLKVTDEEVQFLSVIAMSDSSGELKYINSGKLILIVIMLIGISYRSKKRKSLKKNSLLIRTLSSIIYPNFGNRQIDKQPKLLSLNTDDYDKFSLTLKSIAKELMNLNTAKFREFCVCCKNCVEYGVNCVSCSIGVLMIHLSQSFTDYGSSTAIEMKDYLWSIVSKSINRNSARNRRIFARILNKELNKPIINKINYISKSHIFHSILDSLSEELDDFKSDAVEIVCTFLEYVQNTIKDDPKIREKIIINLQKAFALTAKEREKRRKEREKELKALLEEKDKPKESKSKFLFFIKDKGNDNDNGNNNDEDKSEEYDFSILVYNDSDENTLRLNQYVLSALKLLAMNESGDSTSIFGSYTSTRLSIVDVAEVTVKGSKIEQQLALELFMILFKVQTAEDVVKRFILNMKDAEFNEFCQRVIPTDLCKVDPSWIEILIWIYQSFQGRKTINSNFKQQLFSITLEISCTEGHRCRELALDAINIFSR